MSADVFYLDPSTHLDLPTLRQLLASGQTVKLSPVATQRIEACYQYLHNRLAQSDAPVYGINTGFGALCNTGIAPRSGSSCKST
ncbi:aromatic amino acid lyase [Hymenobacter cellulosilyticus]|uniref:aromatic amino acid lyase n=1 Tax=Hymenobacter cellulosilyticus TaxID=2932248 RepID=UPI002880348E|nr:aromatic amino acid lyase [Hymenobacter cellulosilyticus]